MAAFSSQKTYSLNDYQKALDNLSKDTNYALDVDADANALSVGDTSKKILPDSNSSAGVYDPNSVANGGNGTQNANGSIPDSNYLNFWSSSLNGSTNTGVGWAGQASNSFIKEENLNIFYEHLKVLDRDNLDNNLVLKNSIEIETSYNRYIESYEKKIENDLKLKNLLPFNVYVTYTNKKKNENFYYDSSFEKTLNILDSQELFFDNFSNVFKNDKLEFKNVSIIDNTMLQVIQNSGLEKKFFPFFNSIKLNFYNESIASDTINQYGLDNEFLKYLAYTVQGFQNTNTEQIFNIPNFRYLYSKVFANNIEQQCNIDLMEFFDILKGIAKTPSKNYKTFNQLSQNVFNIYTKNFNKQFKNRIYYQIFGDLIQNTFLFNLSRMNGEIVAFQIQKKLNNEIISDDFFMNNHEIDTFNYTDTQVKYGETYQYDIYGFQINFIRSERDPAKKIRPILTRIKLNKDNINIRVQDNPPLSPVFNPFIDKNRKNTIFFLLDRIVGETEEFRIPLNGDDPDLTKIIKYKNDDYEKQIEVYRLEEEPKSYKDFNNSLLLKASGSGFRDTIETNKFYYYVLRNIDVHDQISNPSYVLKLRLVNSDGLEYLENYIYAHYKTLYKNEVIEVKDFNGNIINSISKKSFTLKPWELFNLNDIRNKEETQSKAFKRYLQIKPSDVQLLINNFKEYLPDFITSAEDNINNSYDAEIFQDEKTDVVNNKSKINSIVGKKYKLRIKSKNSNKVIDLNFSYELIKKIEEYS